MNDRSSVLPLPWKEPERLEALKRYGILDTPSEPAFDDVATLAAQVCEAPIAVINLIADTRQWFKSEIGLGVRETPLDVSICARAILQRDLFVVPDLTQDPAFDCNPLVTGEPHLRFYAGALLETPEGLPLGTLCVLDHKPRPEGLTGRQAFALQVLARQVMTQLDLRLALHERTKTEAALRDSEARHRLILESATDYAIVATDLDGFVTHWNEGARRVLGWTEAEMLRRDSRVIFTPEDRAQGAPEGEMATALAEGRAMDERWHVRKDGSRFWGYGELMQLRDGDVKGFLKILRDRTEQRQAGEALRISEERLQIALDASQFVGTWDWDIRSDILYADARFATLYGVDLDEGTNGAPIDTFKKRIHSDDLASVNVAIERALKHGEEFAQEYRLMQPDGSVRTVFARGRCYRDDTGQPTRFPGVTIDVTERKRSEEALTLSEEKLRLAAETTELGTWDLDLRTQELDWSSRCKAMFGISPDVPVTMDDFYAGLHPDDLAHTKEAFARALNPSIRSTYDVEYRTIGREDGIERWVAAKGRAIFDRDGRGIRAIGTVLDVTKRKRAEDNRELLINELNHRVKNTLATVQSIVAQTLRNAETVEDARRPLEERLFALSRAQDVLTRENWEGANLHEIVAQAVEPYRGDREDRLQVRGPGIRLSPRMALALAMALQELATNAVKYGALSGYAGNVEIAWSIDPKPVPPRLRLRWAETGGPRVDPPRRRGFGSRLIERSLAQDLDGVVHIAFDPGGVVCSVDAPIT